MNDPANEITGVIHEPGRNAGESLWRVFTSFTFADGGQCIIGDAGPLLTRGEADRLVELATAAGVEAIPPSMVNRARTLHLAAMRRDGRP